MYCCPPVGRKRHPTRNESSAAAKAELDRFLSEVMYAGEIANDGTIKKSQLRTMMRQKKWTILNLKNLGKLMGEYRYLLDCPKHLGIYKFDVPKLPQGFHQGLIQMKHVTTEKKQNGVRSLTFDAFQMSFEIDPNCCWIKFGLKNVTNEAIEVTSFQLMLKTGLVWKYDQNINLRLHEEIKVKFYRPLFKVPSREYHFLISATASESVKYWQKVELDMCKTLYCIIRKKRMEKEERGEKLYEKDSKAHVEKVYRNVSGNRLRYHRHLLLPKLANYLPNETYLKLFTEDFNIKSNFGDLVNREEFNLYKELVDLSVDGKLTPKNYKRILKILVEIEDLCCNVELFRFKIPSITVNVHKNYWIDISGISKFPNCIKEGDFIVLHANGGQAIEEIVGIFVKIQMNRLKFIVDREEPLMEGLYSVSFRKDRTCFQMEQKALDQVEPSIMDKILFPTTYGLKSLGQPDLCVENFDYTWFNQNFESNAEQQQAVKNIISGSAYPAPYIIFGPPGTGKTATIVETICQIWKNKPNSKVLVTAPTNAACDEIAVRLLKHIPAVDLYRYYSKSFSLRADVDLELKMISNFSSGRYKHFCMQVIKQFRIILCTVIQSGKIALHRMELNYFEYIFLDECGSSTEPDSLIPISGLTSLELADGRTNLIIAGDPKQLGPVVTCEFANLVGLGRSLLEQLMATELYQPTGGKYDERIITKLLQNFRSHPVILDIPNVLFYDGELIAKGAPKVTDFALNWKWLPNKEFPMIFHGVDGKTKSNPKSFSFYNDEEVLEICRYILEITEHGINGKEIPLTEIGVVSPYSLQCQAIKKELTTLGWHDIQVASAEKYQGKEKMVMLLSTVRSNTNTAGFLGNPKRLNVVMTRAKGLLIIVGNPRTLMLDMNWFKVIEYCKESGATKGVDFELIKPVADRVNVHGNAVQTYEEKYKDSLQNLASQLAQHSFQT